MIKFCFNSHILLHQNEITIQLEEHVTPTPHPPPPPKSPSNVLHAHYDRLVHYMLATIVGIHFIHNATKFCPFPEHAVLPCLSVYKYTKITYGVHTSSQQDVSQQSYVLQPCSKKKVTQRTLVYVNIEKEFCASSNSVMSWSVQQLFHHIRMTEIIKINK
jgi:hypothetical protein